MTEDQKDVLKTIATMTSSFEAGDIPTVISTYEPGASVLFEPGNPVNDGAVLAEMFTQMSGMGPAFDYGGHEVIVSGDIALHIAPWSMKAQTPDGQAITQSGLSVAVLRKQDDGTWRMVIDNPHGQRLLP